MSLIKQQYFDQNANANIWGGWGFEIRWTSFWKKFNWSWFWSFDHYSSHCAAAHIREKCREKWAQLPIFSRLVSCFAVFSFDPILLACFFFIHYRSITFVSDKFYDWLDFKLCVWCLWAIFVCRRHVRWLIAIRFCDFVFFIFP